MLPPRFVTSSSYNRGSAAALPTIRLDGPRIQSFGGAVGGRGAGLAVRRRMRRSLAAVQRIGDSSWSADRNADRVRASRIGAGGIGADADHGCLGFSIVSRRTGVERSARLAVPVAH